jgi:catechol 2,3-dioxygenase-like lactoylglutathione lyase family enzyme
MANIQQAVPFFMVTSMDASLKFYVDGLGFVVTITWTPHGKIEWCWLKAGDGAMMLQEYRPGMAKAELGRGVSVCFMCEDAIAIYHEITARSVVAKRPFVGNGLWVVSVTDPDGYQIAFESPADAPEETEYTATS